MVNEELKQSNPVAVLSGPNIAWEVVRGVPSKGVVACSNFRYLGLLQDVFSTPCFKVYENPDLAGTELGGALKNVIAIMAGIGDGLGYGANTKSAIITRGLQEMIRIGVVMGGHRDTFLGLSGMGDLMATSLSEHSRNRRLGECLGRGAALPEAEAALNGRVAEGVKTTKALVEIKSAFRLETPIVENVHRVLFEGLPAREGYLATWNSCERFEGD
jgi:glycerol-3-phosphate dehydrogenase (NAD(P)+)